MFLLKGERLGHFFGVSAFFRFSEHPDRQDLL